MRVLAGHGHHQHQHHQHTVSDVMIAAVVVGLCFTILCIVMMRMDAYDGVPWHMMGVAVGVPSALLASLVCLRRAFEDVE